MKKILLGLVSFAMLIVLYFGLAALNGLNKVRQNPQYAPRTLADLTSVKVTVSKLVFDGKSATLHVTQYPNTEFHLMGMPSFDISSGETPLKQGEAVEVMIDKKDNSRLEGLDSDTKIGVFGLKRSDGRNLVDPSQNLESLHKATSMMERGFFYLLLMICCVPLLYFAILISWLAAKWRKEDRLA